MTPTDNLFWPYLSPILEAQKPAHGVAYVGMSDGNGMDRLIEDSVSGEVYPAIFVFRPKYTTQRVENHILMATFHTKMYVWCHGKLDDREIQDDAYTKAETILSAILKKLQHDQRQHRNFLDFDSISIEPVVYLGADAAYGYELTMKLGLAGNEIFC